MVVDADLDTGRESLLLRGTLDMCVLRLLAASPSHAYGLVQELQVHGFAQISYGTVYPLVTRLRRQGLVSQESLPGTGGPAKNLLTLTTQGREALDVWRRQWRAHNLRVEELLGAQVQPTPTKGNAHVE